LNTFPKVATLTPKSVSGFIEPLHFQISKQYKLRVIIELYPAAAYPLKNYPSYNSCQGVINQEKFSLVIIVSGIVSEMKKFGIF